MARFPQLDRLSDYSDEVSKNRIKLTNWGSRVRPHPRDHTSRLPLDKIYRDDGRTMRQDDNDE